MSIQHPSEQGRAKTGQADIRRNNLAVIVESLARKQSTSRAQLADRTKLTKATVSALVADLIDAGIVVELAKERDGRLGRPGTPLAISGERITAIGLHIDVDMVSGCLMTLAGNIRASRTVAHRGSSLRAAAVLSELSSLCDELLAYARDAHLDVAGVTVGLPGLVDQRTGHLRSAPNLGWSDVPIVELLRPGVPDDVPVTIDNDANLGALAVQWQREFAIAPDFMYVAGTFGVGAGIVINGRVYRGAHGFGGEFGHMIVDYQGPECGCGSRGCLEALVGQGALCRAAGIDVDVHSWSDELVRRLHAGDKRALAAIARAGEALAAGIISVVNLLDPSSIVLGGYFATLSDWIREPIKAALAGTLGGRWTDVPVTVTRLGRTAETVGGAAEVLAGVIADPIQWIRSERLAAAGRG